MSIPKKRWNGSEEMDLLSHCWKFRVTCLKCLQHPGMYNFKINGLNRFPHILKCGYRSFINISFKIIKKEVKKWNSKKETKRKYSDKKPLSLLDRTVLGFLPRFLHPLWVHPAGIKTIFFWAPTAKWVRSISIN